MRQVQGDRGRGMLLRRYPGEVRAIETPGEWLSDEDTPEDWRMALDSGW